MEGDVIARSGNTLTLRGATLFLNAGQTHYSLQSRTPRCCWAPAPS